MGGILSYLISASNLSLYRAGRDLVTSSITSAVIVFLTPAASAALTCLYRIELPAPYAPVSICASDGNVTRPQDQASLLRTKAIAASAIQTSPPRDKGVIHQPAADFGTSAAVRSREASGPSAAGAVLATRLVRQMCASGVSEESQVHPGLPSAAARPSWGAGTAWESSPGWGRSAVAGDAWTAQFSDSRRSGRSVSGYCGVI